MTKLGIADWQAWLTCQRSWLDEQQADAAENRQENMGQTKAITIASSH